MRGRMHARGDPHGVHAWRHTPAAALCLGTCCIWQIQHAPHAPRMRLLSTPLAHTRAHGRRSAGKKQDFEGETYTIEELTENR